MQLLPKGKQQFFDNNGAPLAGGMVYFYQPGTTIPLTTWADQAGTTANPNPVILDSGGEAVIWGNTTYQQVVTDSSGTPIWTEIVDAAPSAVALSSPSGSDSIGFVQTGSGAVSRTAGNKMREIVSIEDFMAADGSVAAFNRAFAAGKAVEVPSGVAITDLNGQVTVPAGKDLVIYGSIAGNGAGVFSIEGTCEVFARGGTLNNVMISLLAGGPRLSGLVMSGTLIPQQISISGDGPFQNVSIDNFQISNANYGIFRQGQNVVTKVISSSLGMSITRGQFYNLKGDAIELNIVPQDLYTTITDHIIDSIPGGAAQFAGIGIGIAGLGFDTSYSDANTAKRFTIANIRGNSMRQLIHVEAGKQFEIADIYPYDVSSAYNISSGLDVASVAVYGSSDFSVSRVHGYNAAGLWFANAVPSGVYKAPCQNFTVRDVKLSGLPSTGEITKSVLDLGNNGSFVRISDWEIYQGSLTINERPGLLEMRDVFVQCDLADGAAVSANFNLDVNGASVFRAIPSELIVQHLIAVDENGNPSYSVPSGSVAQDKVHVVDSNVPLQSATLTVQSINRDFYGCFGGAFPFGAEFQIGDRVTDISSGISYVVTASGSLNRPLDNFEVVNSTTIKSLNLPWTNANQQSAGHRITLPGCGADGTDLETTVTRVFVASGSYQMTVVDTIVAAVGTTGTISATFKVCHHPA